MQKETRYLECFMPDLASMVDLVCNWHNDWYMDFGNNMEYHIRYISSTKHAGTMMFLGLVCSNREVSPLVLFDDGYWLNADKYIDIMTSTIIPWMRWLARRNLFSSRIGPPPKWPTRCRPSSKKIDFWLKSKWPLQSLDLNPLDCMVVSGE